MVASKCQQTEQSLVYKILKNYMACHSCKYEVWEGYLREGPITVGIDGGSQEIQHYKSGVLNPASCSSEPNHGIVAVGLQKDEQGNIVVLRNSWGDLWGEKGYFRIRVNANTNTCFVTENAWLPKLKMGSGDGLNPVPLPSPEPTPDCATLYDDCQFDGSSLPLCTSNLDLTEKKEKWGHDIKSLKRGNAKKFEYFYFTNCHFPLPLRDLWSSDIKCLDIDIKCHLNVLKIQHMQSVAVSMEAPPSNCIWVFKHNCWAGGKKEICNDIPDLTSLGINDTISSFILGDLVHATFYSDVNYLGIVFGATVDRGNLDDFDIYGFDRNGVSSIRIYQITHKP
jgi:hypothetical protein